MKGAAAHDSSPIWCLNSIELAGMCASMCFVVRLSKTVLMADPRAGKTHKTISQHLKIVTTILPNSWHVRFGPAPHVLPTETASAPLLHVTKPKGQELETLPELASSA